MKIVRAKITLNTDINYKIMESTYVYLQQNIRDREYIFFMQTCFYLIQLPRAF